MHFTCYLFLKLFSLFISISSTQKLSEGHKIRFCTFPNRISIVFHNLHGKSKFGTPRRTLCPPAGSKIELCKMRRCDVVGGG